MQVERTGNFRPILLYELSMTQTVKRAFKYRFYPTPRQAEELARTFGCVRLVYNILCEQTIRPLDPVSGSPVCTPVSPTGDTTTCIRSPLDSSVRIKRL
jgi:hypothetical protein